MTGKSNNSHTSNQLQTKITKLKMINSFGVLKTVCDINNYKYVIYFEEFGTTSQ